jgi:OOP family OmpA-OmpF porin
MPTAAELQAKACEEKLAGLVHSGLIQFATSSARLQPSSFGTLDQLADAAKTCPGMQIEVGGHASPEGDAEVNERLSFDRAQSVVTYLVKAGVDAGQLHAMGYGSSRPIAPNDTRENKAKNRRIEFTVRPN